MPGYRRHRARMLLDHSVVTQRPTERRWPHWRLPRGPVLRRAARRVAPPALLVLGCLVGGGWWWFHRGQSTPFVFGAVKLGTNAPLGGELLFPPDNAWNLPVDTAPVHPMSDTWIATIGAAVPLHPDFGRNALGTELYGIPYMVVDGSATPTHEIPFARAAESDTGPYPIPVDPAIEAGGDRHLLVLDRASWRLYELYKVEASEGEWRAGSGAVFNLRSNELRPEGWSSADAAGLPILPGLVRADEVYGLGEIRHALRFTVPRTQRAYVHPARHFASTDTNPALPPMGMRMRLKASADLSGLPDGAHVIATALQKYGMILADNGGPLFLTGTADRRWKRRDTEALKRFVASDFEVVAGSR